MAVGAVSGVTAALGLPPFWSDTLTALVMGLTAASLARAGFRETEPRVPAGLVRPAVNRSAARRIRMLSPYLGVAVVFLLLAFWSAYPAINHVARGTWQICGTFLPSCGNQGCFRLFDDRGRPIADVCYTPDDDAGWKRLAQPNWWTYRPASIAFECPGKSPNRRDLTPAVFEDHCDIVVKAP